MDAQCLLISSDVIWQTQVDDLTFVKASCRTIRGMIMSHWKIENGAFHWDMPIPAISMATVCLPARDADSTTESSSQLHEAEGGDVMGMCNDRLVLIVESSQYCFSCILSIGKQ